MHYEEQSAALTSSSNTATNSVGSQSPGRIHILDALLPSTSLPQFPRQFYRFDSKLANNDSLQLVSSYRRTDLDHKKGMLWVVKPTQLVPSYQPPSLLLPSFIGMLLVDLFAEPVQSEDMPGPKLLPVTRYLFMGNADKTDLFAEPLFWTQIASKSF